MPRLSQKNLKTLLYLVIYDELVATGKMTEAEALECSTETADHIARAFVTAGITLYKKVNKCSKSE